jgi:hypothetical protein
MITTAVVTTTTGDSTKRAQIKFRHEILLTCNDRSSIDGDYETETEALTERSGLQGAGA